MDCLIQNGTSCLAYTKHHKKSMVCPPEAQVTLIDWSQGVERVSGVNEGMRTLDLKCTASNNNLVLKTLFYLQFKKAEHNTTSIL